MTRPALATAPYAPAALAVLTLALASCSLGAGAPSIAAPADSTPPSSGPPTLEATEGAVIEAHIEPGESHVFPLAMEEGTYLEVHLDQPRPEISMALYDPDVDPSPSEQEYVIGEEAPEYPNQMLWEVMSKSGEHHLRLGGKLDPVDYTLRIKALHPATERDQSRHDGLVTYNQALELGRRPELALEKFLEARELFAVGGYERGVAATYSREAEHARGIGQTERAAQAYREAAKHWRLGGDIISEIFSLGELGELAQDAGDWEAARRYVDMGMARAEAAPNPIGKATALLKLCLYYREQGRIEPALTACRESLRIHEELGLEDPLAQVLITIGRIHSGRGEFDESRACYLRALDLFEKQPSRSIEATVHNDLGILHLASGEYLDALADFQKALAIRQTMNAPVNTARILFNMGTTNARLGNDDETRRLYHESLRLMKQARDRTGTIDTLQGLAWHYRETGDLENAQRMLDEALKMSRGAASDPILAYALLRTGQMQIEREEFEPARESLEESSRLYEAIDYQWQVSAVLRALAGAYEGLGRDELALETLRHAAAVDEEIGKPSGAAECYYRIAMIERARGDLDAALTAIGKALAIVDEVRSVAGTEEIQVLYAATVQPYQELLIDLLMAEDARDPHAGHAGDALREAERRKAQGLREIIAEAAFQLDENVPADLQTERDHLRAEIEAIERRRRLIEAEGEDSPNESFQVHLDLENALTRLQEIDQHIRSESPRYAALTDPEPVSVEEIQSRLLDPETALLEYSLGEERSFLWAVTQDDFRSYVLPGRTEIEANARCVHRLIRTYGAPPRAPEIDTELADCLGSQLEPYRAIPLDGLPIRIRGRQRREIQFAYDRAAAALAEALLGGPARNGLLNQRLAVVSDGALEYVPFAALPTPSVPSGGPDDVRQLVDDHEIVRLPSASVLAEKRRQRIGPNALPSGLIAIVADPVYGRGDPRVPPPPPAAPLPASGDSGDEVLRGIPSRPRLDLSGEEARTIATLVRADRALVIEGFDATRQRVLEGALHGYRYVHFATHGEIDTQYPKLSSLVLSQMDASGRGVENGNLRLQDVYGLDLADTDMVVLSACETALGREVRGEGLMGLTRGFLYAGAERVAATLWQVQDRTTADLMEHFYRGLFEEDRAPADALRHAQLAVRDADGGAYSFPYYWAGFVLQGEWR